MSGFAWRVLDLVDQVPAGHAVSYGDVARAVGGRGARAVGQVLRRHGHEVPWQRVVTASGAPAGAHAEEQLALLRLEGTPLLDGGRRVDLAAARWHWRGRDQPLGRPSHTGAGSAAGPRNVGGAWSNRPIRTSKD